MIQTHVHRNTSSSLQKRTGFFSLEHDLRSRTLLRARHAARMPKGRLPKRRVLPWVRKARPAFGLEMTHGQSLAYNWAHLAQIRTGWRTRVTAKPFDIGATHMRQPRATPG